MNDEHRASIRSALNCYRETVATRNFISLRILIDGIEAEKLDRSDANFLRQQRLRHFNEKYNVTCPDSDTSIRGLLEEDVRSKVIADNDLDGVTRGPVDSQRRAEFFTAVQAKIAEQHIAVPVFPPADLEYVCTLVDGIRAPGLPYYVEYAQFDCLSSVRYNRREYILENLSVIVPLQGDNNALSCVWEEWEIKIAFRIGTGPRGWGGSYALFCRYEGGNDEDEDEDGRHEIEEHRKQWQWRYGVHDETWCSELYDSVEEYLGFYAHFREQTEEEVRKDVQPIMYKLPDWAYSQPAT